MNAYMVYLNFILEAATNAAVTTTAPVGPGGDYTPTTTMGNAETENSTSSEASETTTSMEETTSTPKMPTETTTTGEMTSSGDPETSPESNTDPTTTTMEAMTTTSMDDTASTTSMEGMTTTTMKDGTSTPDTYTGTDGQTSTEEGMTQPSQPPSAPEDCCQPSDSGMYKVVECLTIEMNEEYEAKNK